MKDKARNIKLVLTDCDGVLTDGCVYYSERGEELKKFNFRDGMGMSRLREVCNIDTGIITREDSAIVAKRAEKLRMKHLYMGVKDKKEKFLEILKQTGLTKEEVAYIGDDVNDLEVLQLSGLSAAPADAIEQIKMEVDYVCKNSGGKGAFREFAEFIIDSQANQS